MRFNALLKGAMDEKSLRNGAIEDVKVPGSGSSELLQMLQFGEFF